MATVVGDSAGELREDIPLKTGTRHSSFCSCSEDCFGGSKFISVAFAILTAVITVALLVQIYYGDFQVVPHGSVASDSRECSEIGTSLLKQGGNAVDAAVGTAFCLCVVNAHTTGLDGGGQILIYSHRTRHNPDVVDFGDRSSYGGPLPKLAANLANVHQKYGLLAWKDIVLPSAYLARKGFFVTKQLEIAIKNAHAEKLFGPLQAGEKFNSTLLAETLISVAEMPKAELHKHISESINLVKTDAVNLTFNNFNIYVSHSPSIGPVLLESLQRIERLNLTHGDIFEPGYALKIANVTKSVYNDFNITNSYHQGTSSNVAVIDLNDLYVSLLIGMYAPFGSQQMAPGGYLLDVADNTLPCSRLPIIITDANMVCGKRMVLGANDVVTASQVITTLLIGAVNATSSIEFPRFNFLNNGSVGLEDDHNPTFNDDAVKELETLVNLQALKEPYSSCNIVEKIGDDLNSHSDSRGGGIASRF